MAPTLSSFDVFTVNPFNPEESDRPMTGPDNPSPLVSVIVPMHNAEAYVAKAVASILQEAAIPLEVIVVNNRSTDRSLQRVLAITDPRLRVVHHHTPGIATTLNAGLAVAQGAIVMRCDADDLFPRDRIAVQARWLQDHPEYSALCGSYDVITPRGDTVLQHHLGSQAEEITDELQQGITRTHLGTFAIRTELLRQLGGFRPYFETGEDIDLQLRLGDAGRVFYQPDLYYRYRLHNHSITHTMASERRVFFDRMARTFQLQRQRQGQDDLQRGHLPPVPQGSKARPYTSNQQIQGFLQGRAWQLLSQGQRRQALQMGLRSLGANPSHWPAWKNTVILLAKVLTSLRPAGAGGSAPLPPNLPQPGTPVPPEPPKPSRYIG
jgi:GT2 family glycosyltransferase